MTLTADAVSKRDGNDYPISPGLNFQERRPDFGVLPGLPEKCSPELSLEMFRRACAIRYFEFNVRQARNNKDIHILVYLAVGHEWIAAVSSVVMPGAWVTYQHRCHGYFLAFGGSPIKLIDELMGLPSGCNQGMGGSNCLVDFEKKLIGHNGLIGDNVPIACGIALAKREPSVCFFGDGAAEEDYVMGAMAFAVTHKLPILFVCDDNDLSVLTPIKERRTWRVDHFAKGLGMEAADISDDPWTIEHYARKFQGSLPALLNIRVCRELWHQGTGSDGEPEWHRFNLVKAKLAELGLGAKAEAIEQEEKKRAEDIWRSRLPTRSAK